VPVERVLGVARQFQRRRRHQHVQHGRPFLQQLREERSKWRFVQEREVQPVLHCADAQLRPLRRRRSVSPAQLPGLHDHLPEEFGNVGGVTPRGSPGCPRGKAPGVANKLPAVLNLRQL